VRLAREAILFSRQRLGPFHGPDLNERANFLKGELDPASEQRAGRGLGTRRRGRLGQRNIDVKRGIR
jgi:hypothetical protein